MFDQTDNLENISSYFDEMDKNELYMKEQLTDYSKIEKFRINFTFCHIAISRKGGLIAICKKKGFLDMQRGAVLNRNVVVMYQDAITRYHIPINWDYNKRYIVCLDFTPKEVLYGILNDGGIFKFNYYERKYKEISTSEPLKEGVVKAKFFQKGFIAFTRGENFYYIKDIKNPVAILMCSFLGMIDFSPNFDFLAISSEYSSSNKMELLITNEQGKGGVIQIIQKEEGQNVQFDIKVNYTEVLGAALILREKPQKLYIIKKKSDNEKEDKKGKKDKKDKKEENSLPPDEECQGEQDEIGYISALAISPSGDKIAFYNSKKRVAYLMNADLSEKYTEIYFNYNENDYSDLEQNEIKDLLNYKEGCQFLFCGEDTLALSRQRFIFLSKPGIKKSLIYLIYDGGEAEVKYGNLFSRCISEVDGLRFLTNEGVFLISRVPDELVDVSHPFSNSPAKKLIQIYKNTILRKYNSDKDIRALSSDLADSIEDLQLASANIFWTENNNEEFRKEVQFFVLKAAQYAKKFVNKDEFNHDKFNGICKDIRIINNLRNDKKYPVYITFREYKDLEPKEIIGRLLKYYNFRLAADISKFLDYGIKKVLHKYVIAIMKKEIDFIENTFNKPVNSKVKELENENKGMEDKYSILFYHLENVPGISYIKLAKKASKLGGNKLAIYLLEQEKSALIKIPQLLQFNEQKYEEAIHIAFQTYDFNAVVKVLHQIIKDGNLKYLANPNLQKYFPKIILYLKKYNKDFLIDYLRFIKNNAALFYIQLKDFYNTSTTDDRIKEIKNCKLEYKKVDNDPNFDNKFIKKYLEKLENGINFKKVCQEEDKAIIHHSEVRPYSVSIYECYKSGIMKGKLHFIEPQNKHFDYSSKKFNLLKLRSYLELKRPDAIESLLEKTSLKKMGLSPMHLGEMLYDYKYYDKATEYLMQVKEPFYFSYVVDILKSMEKYKEALEVIISSKDNDAKAIMVDEIVRKQPRLQKHVEELCAKYKVSLQ